MSLTKLYNKTLKHAVLTVLTLLLLTYSSFKYLHVDIQDSMLIDRGLKLHRQSAFNPRDSSVEIYKFINGATTNEVNKLATNDSTGIHFHWDDWVDLSAADKLLKKYRTKNPKGECDSALINFANVNPYYIETYSQKILRGQVDMYCLKEIPKQIIAPTRDGYVKVPVIDKQRVDFTNSNTTKQELLNEFSKVTQKQVSGVSEFLFEYKNFQKEIPLDIESFVFDPDLEILKLHYKKQQQQAAIAAAAATADDVDEHHAGLSSSGDQGGLSEDDQKYLSMLEYANNNVDSAEQFFKYPWILDDIVAGHSHHFAYPYFKRYYATKERLSVIQHLIRGWFQFAEANEIPSWINYGSLLGWAYNGVTMPWDTDIDVQIPIKYFDKLSRSMNGSLILEDPRLGNGKFYFISSPTYVRQGNGKNFIDARFIDVDSGLYIDLTALSHTNYQPSKDFMKDYKTQEERNNAVPVNCKHWNFHSLAELGPIRHTYFEGSSVYIPYNVSRILSRKYGPTSYTSKLQFNGHNYQEDIKMWVPNEVCSHAPNSEVSRFTDDYTKSELTLQGACNDVELMDEYKIVHEYAARHDQLNLDVDNGKDYNIKEMGQMPIYRKDVWDYHEDIVLGIARDFNWFHASFEDDIGSSTLDSTTNDDSQTTKQKDTTSKSKTKTDENVYQDDWSWY